MRNTVIEIKAQRKDTKTIKFKSRLDCIEIREIIKEKFSEMRVQVIVGPTVPYRQRGIYVKVRQGMKNGVIPPYGQMPLYYLSQEEVYSIIKEMF